VTEAHRCEQLSQVCYAASPPVRIEPTTYWSQVQCSTAIPLHHWHTHVLYKSWTSIIKHQTQLTLIADESQNFQQYIINTQYIICTVSTLNLKKNHNYISQQTKIKRTSLIIKNNSIFSQYLCSTLYTLYLSSNKTRTSLALKTSSRPVRWLYCAGVDLSSTISNKVRKPQDSDRPE